MVNFIVLNDSLFGIDDINVLYVDEQSMDGQHADADGVTVLSDSHIPSGTSVSTVTREGVEIAEEPTPVPLPGDHTVIVSLMFYTNAKCGQTEVAGVEIEPMTEG